MRRLVGGLLVFLSLSLQIPPVSAHFTQACATAEPVVQGQFGRLIATTSLMTEPDGKTVKKLDKGKEISIVEGPVCEGTKLWWGVETLDSKDQGWVTDSTLELADPLSTSALRKYGNEWCVATPIETKAIRQQKFSLPRHWIIFDEIVNVENSTFTLLFNGKPLSKNNYTVEEEDGVEITLTRLWALEHSGLKPIWSEEEFWQLTYRCEEVILPTYTPTPLSSTLLS